MNVMRAMPEHRLFTPGPVDIPRRVAAASSYLNYHHRTESFSAIVKEMLHNLRPLFGASSSLIMPVHTTGRGAIEGVYANVLPLDSKVVSVCNGKFGEMSAKIVSKLGISCTRCFEEWTQGVDLNKLESIIIEQGATAITVVHNDTSNGLVNPIGEIGRLARKHNAMLFVDAVSSIGCMPFEFDMWNVDGVITASQKGLMSPPGLSFVILSDRAWEQADRVSSTASYINFHEIKKELEKFQTPGTTPVSVVLAVNEAIHMIGEEGIERVFARHKAIAEATRQTLRSLGFDFFADTGLRSDALTVMAMPQGFKSGEIVDHMQNKYGILIGKGLDGYAQSSLRIAHMGNCHLTDMLTCIAAFEAALYDLGRSKDIGSGLSRFVECYNKLSAEVVQK